LPSGFSLIEVDACRFEIVDLDGNVRATILAPQDGARIPSIQPVKRYSVNAEPSGTQYKGVVYDRDGAVYRTKPLKTQQEAASAARKWLDDNKPRWDSYTSAVNFEPRH
jgi:hypothetical protein